MNKPYKLTQLPIWLNSLGTYLDNSLLPWMNVIIQTNRGTEAGVQSFSDHALPADFSS